MNFTPSLPVLACALTSALAVGLLPANARAEASTFPVNGPPVATELPRRHEGKPLTWDPSFNRMDTPEIVLTLGAGGVALGAVLVRPLQNGWSGGILFDERVRSTLRAPTYQGRLNARDASDVGLGFLTMFPILVDSLSVAYWYRGSDDVAMQMALIDAEALAISAAVQGATTFLAGRERPYVAGCGTEPKSTAIDCNTNSEHRSFFSGHSALSFTSAGLICAHHLRLELFESAADVVTCVSGFVAAGTVASLRMVGDMHYASDVIVGALVGTTIGLGIPLLHHYRRGADSTSGKANGPTMSLAPGPTGVQLVGTF